MFLNEEMTYWSDGYDVSLILVLQGCHYTALGMEMLPIDGVVVTWWIILLVMKEAEYGEIIEKHWDLAIQFDQNWHLHRHVCV
jgi:hypothetical protein